jgi:Rieske 2Fe-2S family protein
MTHERAPCPIPRERLRATAVPLERAVQLPAEVYSDPAVFAFERAAIFDRAWRCLGRAEEVPEPGTYLVSPLTPEGLLVVRGEDEVVRAYYNVCPHRGALLVEGPTAPAAPAARAPALVCPYHAWRFGLDGQLLGAPHTRELHGFDPADHGLRAVRVDAWQGFLFANLDGQAPPLREWLADLPAVLERWRLERLRCARSQTYVARANWKLLCENFAESHHFPLVHPELNRLTPTGRAGSLAAHGPWQGGTMVLRADAETVSLDGARHGRPLLPGCTDQDARLVHDFLVWPTLLLSLQPDYLLVYRLDPLGPRETRVTATIHVAPDAFPGQPCHAPDVFEFWDLTNEQDRGVCEGQQLGVESAGWRPGRYASVEDGTHRFDLMVVRAYGLDPERPPAVGGRAHPPQEA